MELDKPAGCQYEFRVEGHLGREWVSWPPGLELSQETNGEAGRAITILTGSFPDQAALHGLLALIRDLNLKLVSVRQL